MTRIAPLIALAGAVALPLAAGAGEPVVYTSPDGNPPATLPVEIEPANGIELDLYVDYEGGFGGASTCEPTCVVCVNANGDETCGFDVLLEMQTDEGLFAGFTPAQPDYVHHIDSATGRTLRVNGLDIAGMPIRVLIGTLEVDAASANTLQIEVKGVHRVGAASQLDAIQDRVIVKLPEPSLWLQLTGGALGLAWLTGRRRRDG